jgi:hypothetical protein
VRHSWNTTFGEDGYFRVQRDTFQVGGRHAVHGALHTPHCTHHSHIARRYTALATLHAIHCTHHTARNTLHSPHCTQYTALTTLHAIHCTHHTARNTLHSSHCTQYTALVTTARNKLHASSDSSMPSRWVCSAAILAVSIRTALSTRCNCHKVWSCVTSSNNPQPTRLPSLPISASSAPAVPRDSDPELDPGKQTLREMYWVQCGVMSAVYCVRCAMCGGSGCWLLVGVAGWRGTNSQRLARCLCLKPDVGTQTQTQTHSTSKKGAKPAVGLCLWQVSGPQNQNRDPKMTQNERPKLEAVLKRLGAQCARRQGQLT